ncbi:secretin N-terminal domain-containing protein [Alteromonas gracilis]|uniref:secretin N-terminal domain-containing protein n=1 Tax=Alteromonas gracilis TaxID=1479524 RepID=UPI0030D15207
MNSKKQMEKRQRSRVSKQGATRIIVGITAIFALASCASMRGPAYQLSKKDNTDFTKPLRVEKNSSGDVAQTLIESKEREQSEFLVVRPPQFSTPEAADIAEKIMVPKLKDTLVQQQSYNDLPIGVFINEAYGNQLGLDFIMQPSIKKAPDLITLRLNSKLSQKEFYILVTKTLANYGITTFERDGVLVFDYSSDITEETPLMMSGRALPEVPSGNRPMFFIYPLTAVRTPEIRSLLTQLFPNKNEVNISEDIVQNALILKGKPQKVKEAVAAIRLLDKPPMSGMQSAIIQPVVSRAPELSTNLLNILQTEGFTVREGVSNSPVRLLPLETTNQLIVFAKSEEVLDYVLQWARKLESQRQKEVQSGLFSYQVQSTQAAHIVDLLNQLGVANGVLTSRDSNQGENGTGQAPSASRQTTSTSNNFDTAIKGRYAVDETLNTILFSGSSKDWLQALPMIKRLDKPAPSVMIEVILAEVSLEESEESAIEWLFKSSVDSFNAVGQTIGGLGYSGGGFNYTLKTANDTRAQLNFLYENSRSTIRSRPRLMVKSGEEASIDVGDRVPIITQNVQSTVTDTAQVVQQVSYQDTGVLLDIKPTVHATGFVDIEISQELSEAVNTDSSAINSPTIRTRSLQTSLTLRDGGSVLIGGLIRANEGEGEVGVPVLGKLPLLGKLFRGDNMEQRRTELVIMIIPYILSSPDEAESLSDELQKARMEVINSY